MANETTADQRHLCDYPMCSERGAGRPLACNCRVADQPNKSQTTKVMCDCELGHNGCGMAVRECDCDERKAAMSKSQTTDPHDVFDMPVGGGKKTLSEYQSTTQTLIRDMLERANGFNACPGIYNGRIIAEELLHWAKKLDKANRNV